MAVSPCYLAWATRTSRVLGFEVFLVGLWNPFKILVYRVPDETSQGKCSSIPKADPVLGLRVQGLGLGLLEGAHWASEIGS